MRSFLNKVVARGAKDGGGLIGRVVAVGDATVRVEASIGEGGFATIYRARDVVSGEAVALKHVRLGGDAEAAADCHMEVCTMARLRGAPHVLALRAAAYVGQDGEVVDVLVAGARGTAPQEAFLVMDLCVESLADRLRAAHGGPLPLAEAAAAFAAACAAVRAMHAADPPTFHRDVKAENVLCGADGVWVLCDFGSATTWAGVHGGGDAIMVAEDEVRRHTTPAYRAPELFDLYSRERVDGAADAWSLGVLLYLLATGRLPFPGEAKLQVLNGTYAPLPDGVPSTVRALVGDLLRVTPAERPSLDDVSRRAQAWLVEVAAGREDDGQAGGGGSGAPASDAGPAASAGDPGGRRTSTERGAPLGREPLAALPPAVATPLPPGEEPGFANFDDADARSVLTPRRRRLRAAGFAAFEDADPAAASGLMAAAAPAAASGMGATPAPATEGAWGNPGSSGSPRAGAARQVSSRSFWASEPPTTSPARPRAGSIDRTPTRDTLSGSPIRIASSVAAVVVPAAAAVAGGGAGPAADLGSVDALRRRLADVLAENAALNNTLREQQDTIRRLQAAASERGAGGLSGVPGASRVVHGRPPPDDQGWATFGDGGASPPLGGGETPTAVSTSPQPAGWQGPDPFAAATGTPLAPLVMGTSGPGGGHRRASSEPTPVESWRL